MREAPKRFWHSIRRMVGSKRGGATDVVSQQSLASVPPSIELNDDEEEDIFDDDEEEDSFFDDDEEEDSCFDDEEEEDSCFDDAYRKPDDDGAWSVGSQSKSSSYHSTTSSHRSRAKPQEVGVDTDVWSDENNSNDDLSTASRRSENSTKPTSIVVPGEIKLVNGAEEEADGISLGEDDKSATSIGSGGSKASRASRRRSRGRNADPFRSKGRDSDKGRNFYEEGLKDDDDDDELEDFTSYVIEKPIVDPYGEKGVYTGEFFTATSMPNGSGRMDYEKEGRWYDGEWIHGRWTGRGSSANGDGDFYKGSFKNDKKHGHGVMKFADGRIFEGDCIRGQMIQGKMTYQDGSTYTGSWVDGIRHGKGRSDYADGSFYDGEFREGAKHGEGVMKFADGRIFEGEYIRGQMIQGKMTYQDGSMYTGSWMDGMRHGKGRVDFADGSFYKGEFREGDFDGHGKMVWEDGGWYFGEWRQGTMHGHGKEIRAGGSLRHDGEWSQGDPIREKRKMPIHVATDRETDGSTPTNTTLPRPPDEAERNQRRSGNREQLTSDQCNVHKTHTKTQTKNGIEQNKVKKHSLRPSANRFFLTLRDYLSCRKQMETAFKKDGNMYSISAIEARCDSGGIEKHNGRPNEYKSKFQQQSVAGTPVKSLDDLYEAANYVMPIFGALVNDLARKACESKENNLQSTDDKQLPQIVIAKKGRDRAQEKATNDYAHREPAPAISWLFDIVRGSIEFKTSEQILRCLKLLLDDKDYYVVKSKNRFKNPTLTGYRDFAIWIQIQCKGFLHVCEIQIHHAGMKKLDSELGSHGKYEHFRWYFSGAVDSLSGCLQDLEMISEGYQLEGFSVEVFIKDCVEEDRLERLASLFHEKMCEFDLALAIYEKLLQLRQLRYDKDHIAIAKTYDSQAAVYRDKGQLDRAMELYEKCLPLYKGTSKMSLAATYQHMAVIKTESGFAKTGLLLYQRSLDILSAMPPETVNKSLADIYNNMGNAKRDLGFLDDAIALHQKSLDMKKGYLGEEHSSVATSLNNLGLVRLKQGMVDKAVDLFLEALKVDQRVVGAEHSSIAVTQWNLGTAYEQKRDFEAAREMYGQALKQQRSILGNQHEEVAGTLDNLGRIHVKEHDFDRAIELLQESLEIKTKAFDPGHAEVAATKKMLDSAIRKKSREKADIDQS